MQALWPATVVFFGWLASSNVVWLLGVAFIVVLRLLANRRWSEPPIGTAAELAASAAFAVSVGIAHSLAFGDGWGIVLLIVLPGGILIGLLHRVGELGQSLFDIGYVVTTLCGVVTGLPVADWVAASAAVVHLLAATQLVYSAKRLFDARQ